jgi:hypothetical protein
MPVLWKEGPWARECHKKKDEEAHATQVDTGESVLLVVAVLEEMHASSVLASTSNETVMNTTEVHLQEDKLL